MPELPVTDLLSAERLRHIVDALPAYIAYVDASLHYVMVNRTYEEWFGKSAAQIIGCRVGDVLGSSFPTVCDHLMRALSGETQQFETHMETVAGTRFLAIIHLPDRDENGVVRGVIVHGHDITWRRQQEEALLRTEKLAAVGRLASSIAHEINNPLESVVNLLYLIEHSAEDADILEYAKTAQEELARVSQIATQTLRFFKQSTLATQAKPAELIDSVLALYQGRLLNSGIEVTRRCRGEADGIWYENEMRQVLNNLVSNAIDAMRGTGGHLAIRSRVGIDPATSKKGVRITVSDTGPGMDLATQSRIFEPFFTTKGIMGTGLGLWVSAEIVRKHNGRLDVYSSQHPQHHGTVFTLDVPFGMINLRAGMKSIQF